MEQSRRAERHAVLMRWAALVAGVLLLADALPPALVGLGIATIAFYNGVLMAGAATSDRYARWGRHASVLAWLLDIVAVSLSIALSRPTLNSLYLLYTLVIVGAGYVSSRPRRILLATAGSVLGYVGAQAAARLMAPNIGAAAPALLTTVWFPVLVLLAAAALATSLYVFKQRDDAMHRRDRKLSTLLEFGTRFASGEDAARVMEQTLRAAIRDTGATSGYIMLVNREAGELATEVALSLDEERPFPQTRAFGEGIEGYVAQTGKPLVLARQQDASTAATVAASQQEERKRAGGKNGSTREALIVPAGAAPSTTTTGIRYDGEAALCIPLVEAGPAGGSPSIVLGVFTLLNHRPGSHFLDEDVDLARTVAGLATMAIVNSRLHSDLRTSFMRSLQVLANTLDAKDNYTQGHSHRVSALCVLLARRLRVAPELIDDLRNGALLHDIGKIGIPDAVLSKPGRLTDEEFGIMKQHPVIGYEICQPLGLDEGILMLIRNHHEKLDGTGYPDGLKLGELPLSLRIICVADAFDAMSSSRPYRKVMDAAKRNAQLNQFAGTQFDPVVIETLKSLLEAGELDELYKDHWNPQQTAQEAPAPPPLPDNVIELPLAKAA